jgi:hypothetical protein
MRLKPPIEASGEWWPAGQWIAFSRAAGPVTNHQSADVSI